MAGRTSRKWNCWIPKWAWNAVVQGEDGELPLAEYVHDRINRDAKRLGFRWHKGRWSTVEELKRLIEEG